MSLIDRPPRSLRRATIAIATALIAGATIAPGVSAGITQPYVPSSTKALSPGIDFTKGIMRTSGSRRQSVRVATVDASDPAVTVKSLLSNGKVVRKERPSRLARRKSRPGRMAMVATNGDRSVFGRNDAYAAPHSMMISNGELIVAQACARPTLGIDSTGVARISDVRAAIDVQRVGKNWHKPIKRVNTHRDDQGVVLFTKKFGARTKTKPGGIEVVLDLPHVLLPNDVQVMRVLKVKRGGYNTRLRNGQAVLSVKSPKANWVKDLRAGHRLRITTSIVRRVDKRCGGTIRVAGGWHDTVEAMGGNYFTMRGGKVDPPSRSEDLESSQRHPRTGVGVTADGRILMVTVDGRRSGYSVGVSLKEMGQLMKSLGATDALNLYGGGSTVLAKRNIKNGRFRVNNRPSDGRERVHSQALTAFAVTP